MGGGGGGGDTQTTIRYAPYVEQHHSTFLNYTWSYVASGLLEDSPYHDYEVLSMEDAFFGAGYLISSFPSLYDMYGKFMAGLDIEVLWTQSLEDTLNNGAVESVLSAEADMMDEDVQNTILPRFMTGMRDINAVMSSSFVIGKAVIEDARVKGFAKTSAGIKLGLIPIAQSRWESHLNWNKTVIMSYAEIMKLYITAKLDIDLHNMEMRTKDLLWPFTLLDHQRLAVACLQGATDAKSSVKGASRGQSATAGALGGAAAGAMIGSEIMPGYGTAIGAVVGGIAGLIGGYNS